MAQALALANLLVLVVGGGAIVGVLAIMPPLLRGRAEGVRTALRTAAQALAPLLFAAFSDYVFGGGRNGLQWTFAAMLLPLAASAYFLFRGLETYPRDVATAAATAAQAART